MAVNFLCNAILHAMRLVVKRFLVPTLILLLGGGAFAALKASKPSTEPVDPEEKAWIVAVQGVAPATLAPTLTLYGRVESPRLARLSAAITADVRAVAVREGESVEVGQVLVTLDDRESVFLLQERDAELTDIQAQIESEKERHQTDLISLKHDEKLLELSRKAVHRARDLVSRNMESQSQLDTTQEEQERRAMALEERRLAIREHRNRLAQLEARLARAQALRDRAALDVAWTRVSAPFAGRVAEVPISPGDRVRAGDSLVSVYDTSAVELRAQIPSRYLPLIRDSLEKGNPLAARARVDRREILATLDRLAGQVVRGSGGVNGLFRVGAGGAWLELGRTLELVLSLPAQSGAVALPVEALYGTNRLFRLNGDRLAGLTVERLGELRNPQGDHRVLVRSPELRAGDKVVVTQLPNAIDGLRVRIGESSPVGG